MKKPQLKGDTVFRIYTNDLALEEANQAAVATAENRLAVLRNRIARAHGAKLVTIAVVAKKGTVANEARAKLTERGELAPGQKLAEIFEVVESRRPSQSKQALAVGLATPVEA